MALATGFIVNFSQDGTDLTEHIKQLTILKDLGCTGIRINIPTYLTEAQNASFRDALIAILQAAKNMGFVTIGGYNFFPLNSGNFAAAKAAMRSYATRVTGIVDIICVGNEEDLNTGYTQAQLRTQLKDICQTIKVTDGFPGIV